MHDSNRSSRRWIDAARLTSCCLIWLAFVLGGASLAVGGQEAPQVEPAPTQETSEEAEASPADAPVVADESRQREAQEIEAEAQEREADAQAEQRRRSRSSRRHTVDKDTQVHFMSDLEIDEGEVAREAVVLMGSLHVRGKVLGDAVSIMGPAYIDGEVTGTVTAVGDDVYLGAESEVVGDVISVGGRVEREPGARVLGEVSEIDIGPALHFSHAPWDWDYDGPRFWDGAPLGLAWSVFWTIFRWVLLILVTSFVFLVARDAVEHTATAVSSEPWKAGLLGLATWLLFFPLMVVATIVLALSIIGIPLLIIVWPLGLFVLLIACLVGYTATAYALGGWLGRRFGWTSASPYVALLVGVIAIQIFSLIAEIFGTLGGFFWFFALMFGLAGWVIRFSAWTAGLGAAIMAFAERRRAAGASPPLPPPPAPPPAPTPPSQEPDAPGADSAPGVLEAAPGDAPGSGDGERG